MSLDPKSDVRFQSAMQKIWATVNSQHDVGDSTNEADKVLFEKLVDLRTDFVIAVWVHSKLRQASHKKILHDLWTGARSSNTPMVHSEEEVNTFGKFALLRKSREAQAFLRKNLYFFERIDAQIYSEMKDAVNAHIAERLNLQQS